MSGPAAAGTREVVFSALVEPPFGAQVLVVGSLDETGCWQPAGGFSLKPSGKETPLWSASARFSPGVATLEYKFVQVLSGGAAVWEDGPNRVLRLDLGSGVPSSPPPAPKFGAQQYQPSAQLAAPLVAPPAMPPQVFVPLANAPQASVQSYPAAPSSASVAGAPSVAPASDAASLSPSPGLGTVTFEAHCRGTAPGDILRIVGSSPSFGSWNPTEGLRLSTSGASFPVWSATAQIPVGSPAAEWKLVICGPTGDTRWETCPNRTTLLPPPAPGVPPSEWTVRLHWEGSCAEPDARGRGVGASARGQPAVNSLIGGTGRRSSAALADEAQQDPAFRNRRSASLSLVSDDVAAPSTLTRAVSGGGAQPQSLQLRLRSVPEGRASALVVEVAFDGALGRQRLQLEEADADDARWSLTVADAGLPAGLHHFHFLVDGERVLSCDHPTFGESNAVLVSDPIRKYLARDTPERDEDVGKSRALSTSGQLESQNAPLVTRPWSVAFNLSTLAEEDAEESADVSPNKMCSFNPQVFEGLYDGELRLRIDSFELPEADAAGESGCRLRFLPGAHILKKKMGVCEDAYFTSEHALGVADGVGCMVQFAKYGVNAAAYAADLMSYASQAFSEGGVADENFTGSVEERAAVAVAFAEQGADAYGASTITTMALDGSTAGCANLGDSGFLLLRKTQRGMAVVTRSEEQQHSWNCPYQLTRLPKALACKFPNISLDTAADCDRYRFQVRVGDLVLLFTDGLRDNLHEREILHIVDRALPPIFSELVGLPECATTAEAVARALALAAQERSLDPTAKVPFGESSKRYGLDCQGGKQDDITVVAAWVVPEEGEHLVGPAPLPARAAERCLRTPSPLPARPAEGEEPEEVELLASTLSSATMTSNDADESSKASEAQQGTPSPVLAATQRLHRGHKSEQPRPKKFEPPNRSRCERDFSAGRLATPAVASVAAAAIAEAAAAVAMGKGTPRRSSSRGRACRAECRPLSGACTDTRVSPRVRVQTSS
mmetsp:Transcript_68259/g.183717  ORF Transcript_68259/g.183717 Transcript_68259/m.183717 type:complete len:1008 (+) Transcript_68259:82-3105(+)